MKFILVKTHNSPSFFNKISKYFLKKKKTINNAHILFLQNEQEKNI